MNSCRGLPPYEMTRHLSTIKGADDFPSSACEAERSTVIASILRRDLGTIQPSLEMHWVAAPFCSVDCVARQAENLTGLSLISGVADKKGPTCGRNGRECGWR
jgi:hypothetical protein